MSATMTKAHPYPPLHGVKLYAMADWPKVPAGTEEQRITGHWLTYWLARQLKRIGFELEPDIVVQRPCFRDADMIMRNEHLGGPALFGSPAQIDALIQTATRQPPTPRRSAEVHRLYG